MQIAHIVNEVMRPATEAASADSDAAGTLSPHDVFVRIGMLTRNLHDTLRQLGYDKHVENAVGSLPDVRARLDYIAALTGKAALLVLDTAESVASIQGTGRKEAVELRSQWIAALGTAPDAQALLALGLKTLDHLAASQERHDKVDGELSKIMLVQDFHELTGPVIQRVTRLAQSLEEQLVKLLLDASPPPQRKEVLETTLAWPVIDGNNRENVATKQGQVDDLLKSLGF